MSAPVELTPNILRKALGWTAHSDRFLPELERIPFTFKGKESDFETHMLSIRNTDDMREVIIEMQRQVEEWSKLEIAGGDKSMKSSMIAWHSNFKKYFDGCLDYLVCKINVELPVTERIALLTGPQVT